VKRKRIGVVLIVLGALLALGIGVYVYVTAAQTAEIARQTPTQDVVVAVVELPERMPVAAASVAIAKVPAVMVPASAATKLNDVVGKYPLTRIYRNEIVIQDKLADTAGRAGPSFALKEAMVAVTLAGSDLLTPTGAVRPGDRVDMLLTLSLTKAPAPAGAQGDQATAAGASIPAVTQTLLQNLEVLQIGNFPAAGQANSGAAGKGSITFQVSHQDALILKWAKDSGGVIDYALRHPDDREPVTTDPITASYIFKKFNFQLAQPIQ
jgi:pilus assembly protein CpaB